MKRLDLLVIRITMIGLLLFTISFIFDINILLWIAFPLSVFIIPYSYYLKKYKKRYIYEYPLLIILGKKLGKSKLFY